MLREFIGHEVVAIRKADGYQFSAKVISAKSPRLCLDIADEGEIQPGDEFECSIGDGVNFARMEATVMDKHDDQAELWINVISIVPGFERAPRAVAPGTVVTIKSGDKEFSASLCDCSESGLRISCLEVFEVGEELNLVIVDGHAQINLRAKVVRIVRGTKSDYIEMGMQILEADRLNQARWNHMVASLLKRFGNARVSAA